MIHMNIFYRKVYMMCIPLLSLKQIGLLLMPYV